jgi:hypothetical protein
MISNNRDKEPTVVKAEEDTGIEKGKETRDNGTQVISMPEINSTIPVDASARFLKKFLSFAGPGFLIAKQTSA